MSGRCGSSSKGIVWEGIAGKGSPFYNGVGVVKVGFNISSSGFTGKRNLMSESKGHSVISRGFVKYEHLRMETLLVRHKAGNFERSLGNLS